MCVAEIVITKLQFVTFARETFELVDDNNSVTDSERTSASGSVLLWSCGHLISGDVDEPRVTPFRQESNVSSSFELKFRHYEVIK